MPNQNDEHKPGKAAAAPETTPASPTLWPLDDWCALRSASLGRRVESLSAFHHKMQQAGISHGTADQWEAGFQAFLSAPAGRGNAK